MARPTAAENGTPAPPARDAAIDVLRGWAIIGVVVIHACGLILPAQAYFSAAYYFRWAVPVFICAYAYFAARPPAPGQTAAVIAGRYARLLWPFLFYSVLYAVVLGDARAPDPLATLWRYLRGDGWAGQYFFLILFQLVVLLPWLAGRRIPLAAVALSLAGLVVLLALLPAAWQASPALTAASDRLVVYWLPYALLGIYLRQNRERWLALLARMPRGLALAAWLACPLWLSFTYDPDWPTGPYLLPGVVAVSAAVFVLHPRALDGRSQARWAQPLAGLGRHSLVVFCLNPLCVWALQQTVLATPPAALPFAAAVVLAALLVVAICALCWAAGWLMRRAGWEAVAG